MPDEPVPERWFPNPGTCIAMLSGVIIAQPLFGLRKTTNGWYSLWLSCAIVLIGSELFSLHLDGKRRKAESAKRDKESAKRDAESAQRETEAKQLYAIAQQMIAMQAEALRDGKMAFEAIVATRKAVERGQSENSLKVRALNTSGSVFEALVDPLTMPAAASFSPDFSDAFKRYSEKVTTTYSGYLDHVVSSLLDEMTDATEHGALGTTEYAARVRNASETTGTDCSASVHDTVSQAKKLQPSNPAVIRKIGELLLEAAKKLPDQ